MHKNECTRLDANRDFDALWYWLDELSIMLRLIKIYMSMKCTIEFLTNIYARIKIMTVGQDQLGSKKNIE